MLHFVALPADNGGLMFVNLKPCDDEETGDANIAFRPLEARQLLVTRLVSALGPDGSGSL